MIGDTVQTSVGEGVVVAHDAEKVCVALDGILELFPKSAIVKLHSAAPTHNNLHLSAGQKNATVAVKLGADSIDVQGVKSINVVHHAGDLPETTLCIVGYPNIDHYIDYTQ